jgi:tight adherence protein B
MSLTLIYASVFAAVLILVDTLARAITGFSRSRREVNDRLARLSSGEDQAAIYKKLMHDRAAEGGLSSIGIFSWAMRLYRQSGLRMSVGRRILYTLVILGIGFLIAAYLTPVLLWRFVLGIPIGIGLLIFLMMRLRSRRLLKFVQQLPVATDIIVRSLAAGHPLTAAIALVGREMPDPIGSEFGILSDQLTFGSELDQAMLNMVDRVGADELNLLAVTVSVQKGTGGNLGEILENLSKMIRDRTMLRAKIKAISAEGRITAVIMSCFPPALYLMISTLVPTYFDPVWQSGYGPQVVGAILVIMTIGVFILFRMVRFDF